MKLFRYVNVIILALVVLTGCATAPGVGQVDAVQAGTTLFHMNQAIGGKVGHFIMTNGESYLFVWGQENGVGFTMMNSEGAWMENWIQKTGGKGMVTNWKDAQDMVSYMRGLGWKTISPLTVPQGIALSIQKAYAAFQSSTGGWSMFMRGCMVVVVPVASVTTSPTNVQNWIISTYTENGWE